MALPSNAYLYEFLYRGQPAGSAAAAAYHVIVGIPSTDAFGNPTLTLSSAMTPDQAVAQGIALPDLLSSINTATTAQVTALQAQVTTLQAQVTAAPASAPLIISDRQFFQQLAIEGKITEAEALAYVAGGTLPASMQALIAQLPSDQQFGAKMLIVGATQFDRGNALVAELGTLYGMSGADLDALWAAAALL